MKKKYLGKIALDEANPISSPKQWIEITKREFDQLKLKSGKLLFDVEIEYDYTLANPLIII